MDWTKLPAGEVDAAMRRLMDAFGNRADIIVRRINANKGVARRVAKLFLSNGYEPSTSQVKAREIMGKNMFGVEEAQKHFGVTLTKAQLGRLAEIPFSEEVLTACKDTHVLVAVVPLTILEIRGIAKKQSDRTLFYSQDWYDNNAVGNDACALGWHLVRKTWVPGSNLKTWQEQQNLIDSKIDEIPEANVMVYTIIGHFLNTGERLFENEYVRTRTLNSVGVCVLVGFFDSDGLSVSNYSDADHHDDIGLPTKRKQQTLNP